MPPEKLLRDKVQWCWRRLFRVPWTARRSNQSVLKEISPGCSLEGMMLKLKLQSLEFGYLMWRVDSHAGRDWGQEEEGTTEDEMAGWHHWLDGHWVWVNSGSWWWTGRPGVLQFMGLQRVRHDWATELNWTELNWKFSEIIGWGPDTIGLVFLKEERTPECINHHPFLSPSLSLCGCICMFMHLGMAKWKHSKKTISASQEESPHQEQNQLKFWSHISNLQNSKKINFCYFNYPVYSILFVAAWVD